MAEENQNFLDPDKGINPENLSDELKEVYKSMQADYTRKTQAIADEQKQFQEERTGFEEKLKEFGAVENEVQQWRQWYANLETTIDDDDTKVDLENLNLNSTDDLNDDPTKHALSEVQKILDEKFSTYDQRFSTLEQSLKDTSDQTGRMFSYNAQLNELSSEFPSLNRKELLDYALENGQTDLRKAYEDLHRDEIINAEVEKRLKLKEAEDRTAGITGTGKQVILKSGDGVPKSFAEASEQVLKQRASEGKF